MTLRRHRALHARLQAPVWSLRTQLARAVLLGRNGTPADDAEALLLIDEVRTMSVRLGSGGLTRRADELA